MRAALLLGSVAIGWCGSARAQTDFLPDNRHWNGFSELASVARGLQLRLLLVDRLDWSELDAAPAPAPALLLVYPRGDLPEQQLLSFVRRGGRLLIADDFGDADGLLSRLGIRRIATAPVESGAIYDGNPRLPVARAGPAYHRLVRGVDSIVTNHPAYFLSRLPTLAGFDDGRQQLLVAGETGSGRFVALSDPSVLINGMLRFRGNLVLATQLLRHLGEGGDGRLLLLTRHFQTEGALAQRPPRGGPVTRVAGQFNDFVVRINDFALTDAGMRALAFVFGTVALATLLLTLPLPRRDLEGQWAQPGRLAAPPGAQEETRAAMALRDEIEDRLLRRLQIPGPISTIQPAWVVNRVRQQVSERAAQTCARLLSALRQVPYTDSPESLGRADRTRPRELALLYDLSARLLQLLGEPELVPITEGDEDIEGKTNGEDSTAAGGSKDDEIPPTR